MGQQTAQEQDPPTARGAGDPAVPPQNRLCRDGARLARRRLWRHRDKPALCAARIAHSHLKAAGVTDTGVLGTVSLLIWALFFTVTAKYVLFLMHADNKGEGGTLSLMALAQSALGPWRRRRVFFLGVAGAALFSGDAVITPAISVLSALEGLELVTPVFSPYILPLTIIVLVSLFWAQRRGTARIAAFFGPVMAVFFVTIGVLGVIHIGDAPRILLAFNPIHGLKFLFGHGMLGFVVLGSVFLAVTGSETLYADMGHFGRGPIQVTWLVFVLPALTLNYLGQGALVLADPSAVANPFFLLAPHWALLPLVILATVATIIASQAVITGAFSVVRQAIQLGLLPRMLILHTSETQEGQIFIPRVNRLLLTGVLLLVLFFKTSSSLASAYGIAVSRHDGGDDSACFRRGMEDAGAGRYGSRRYSSPDSLRSILLFSPPIS